MYVVARGRRSGDSRIKHKQGRLINLQPHSSQPISAPYHITSHVLAHTVEDQSERRQPPRHFGGRRQGNIFGHIRHAPSRSEQRLVIFRCGMRPSGNFLLVESRADCLFNEAHCYCCLRRKCSRKSSMEKRQQRTKEKEGENVCPYLGFSSFTF